MRPLRFLSVVAAGVAATVAACGDPFGLTDPAVLNVVDSLQSVYALSGTPVTTPSAYRLFPQGAVRTDQEVTFDFAFDIDTARRAVLLPTGALRLGRASGIQTTGLAFDSVRLAPDRGYQLDSAVVVDSGTVALVHSGPSTCGVSLTPIYYYYAKLLVLRVDSAARRLDFQILIDKNCGYRGLELGLPRR
jgi:hypothetical protein